MTGIKNILKGDFVKSVAVLMTGTVLAQVISYALWPIIADYYNQSQMADFNLYMRVISFIGALATARFEMSLPLPKSDSHSFLLFRLSLKIAMITPVDLRNSWVGLFLGCLWHFQLLPFRSALIVECVFRRFH